MLLLVLFYLSSFAAYSYIYLDVYIIGYTHNFHIKLKIILLSHS